LIVDDCPGGASKGPVMAYGDALPNQRLANAGARRLEAVDEVGRIGA
jgi:hypothetical protein